MTKKLSKEEKKERKAARKQQKAPSTTSTHVTQPKHEGSAEPPADLNLCDSCAYEFGECEGKPKLAGDTDDTLTGAAADRVTACEGYLNVESMPTADQAKKDAEAAAKAGAAAEEPPQGEGPDAAHDGGDNDPPEAEEEEPGEQPEPRYVPAPGPAKPDPKRFAHDETDYGTCPS